MSAFAVPDLATYLEGRWSVDRELRDGDRRGTFRGTATFSRVAGRVMWDEEGEVELTGHRGPARRVLELVRDDGGWEVRFDDGRPFHRLDLSSGRCAAGHDCGADRYDGTFVVHGRDAFDVVWRVGGPAKDQEIVSRYRRG